MAVGAIYLTDTSSGAPALSGSNGTLCNVLDWALVQKGWSIEYTATNNRVYRPGAGNRNRLYVGHDSAVSGDARLATIRGCENASAAAIANLTNPFPTVAQVTNANSTVCVSQTATASARSYRIIVTDRFVLMATNCNSQNTASWDFFVFGDLAGAEAGDSWATVCHVGGTSVATTMNARAMVSVASPGLVAGKTFWCRSIDGTVLSTQGCLNVSTGTSGASHMGSVTGAAAIRAGYANRVDREKVAVNCLGSASTTPGGTAVLKRGWIPNLWNPCHSSPGGVTTDDTFTDTAYAVGSSFTFAIAVSSGYTVILETSDTWSPPSG